MKIIAFGASTSNDSINKQLATYAASLFENATVDILDLNDYAMPIFSVDIEKTIGQHSLAQVFLDKIEGADLLVVSMSEHNGNYNASFKNTFDWCTRINGKVFQQKPMLLLATSTGAKGGASVLEIAKISFPQHGAVVKATFSLPSFNENFDTKKGKISNTELDNALRGIIGLEF